MAGGGDAAASALAFAQALGQLQKARMADAEAAKFAAQTDSTVAQAKTALAAAARQAAEATKAEAAAQKAAAKEAADAQKEAAALAAQWSRERVAAEKAAAKEAATAQREAAKEASTAAKEQKKAAEEQAKAQKKAAEEQAAAFAKQQAATDAARQPMRDLGDSAAKMGYGMMAAHGPIGKVQGLMAQLGPQGQAAAAALGVATLGITALVGAIVGGMSTAIGVVEKMTQRLAVFSALGGSAAAGKQTMAMVSQLSERLPFATSQLSEWAQAMMRAGLQGKGLESAVKAVAAAAALNPEGGAEAAQAVISALKDGTGEAAKMMKQFSQEGPKAEKKLREMGITMADLGGKAAVAKMTAGQLAQAIEKALVKRGAGPLEAMMNTWPVILDKAKSGFMSLFGGLGKSVEPFMASVRSLFSMFNKGSPTMAALRGVITSVFSTLFSWATKATDVIHSAFQQVVIAALKVRIGINPIVVALRELRTAVGQAIAATGLFQGKSTALATVMSFVGGAIKGAFTFAVYSIKFFIGGLIGMVNVATIVITKVRSLFKNLSLPNLAAAAGNMISSFVQGITGKIGSVIGAMMGMGQAAKRALFGALGIASPSKVALEAAGNVTSTFADRVDDGKAETSAAFTGMVKVPEAGKGGGGKGAGGASAALVAVLDRVATALELNPGGREMLIEAFAEAMQEGA